ncbi:MAG: flagellar motor stator protein MotA [Gemmatimonadales bacterium]|nr:flagellar motor stator protein MotA [Gemmatimonadales bacterium]
MLALVGLLVVLVAVLGGFAMAGGPFGVLLAWSEWVVICGTALGTLLVSTPMPVIKALAGKLGQLIKASPYTHALYLDTLKLQYELYQLARKDGLIAIESHIERPAESAVFKKYPSLGGHEEVTASLCDALRIVLVGSVPPHDLEAMLDAEIDVHHEEDARPIQTLQRVSDSLPGIGIVAAVLGIVVTMQSLAGPIEEIGHHVASALVGTFLGVLLAYGFVSPIASNLEARNAEATRLYHVMKAGVVAFAKGFPPIMAVEFARKAIGAHDRPSFLEMETACKGTRAKGSA